MHIAKTVDPAIEAMIKAHIAKKGVSVIKPAIAPGAEMSKMARRKINAKRRAWSKKAA